MDRFYAIATTKQPQRWVAKGFDGKWFKTRDAAGDLLHPIKVFCRHFDVTFCPQQAGTWPKQATSDVGEKCRLVKIDLVEANNE